MAVCAGSAGGSPCWTISIPPRTEATSAIACRGRRPQAHVRLRISGGGEDELCLPISVGKEAARRQAEEDAWLERSMAEPVEPGHVRIVQPPSYATEGVILDNLDGTEPLVPEPTRITAAPPVTEVPIAPVEPPAPVTAPDQMGRRAKQAQALFSFCETVRPF